ncbi:MAG: FecR domain-containing protein [Planctomycetota bacterium]
MSNEEIRHLLNAHIDGELTESEAARLDARLKSDPAAQSELDALRTLDSELRTTLAPFAGGAATTQAILDKLPKQRHVPIPVGPRGWLIGLSGVAAGFLAALLILHSPPPKSPIAPTAKLEARFDYGGGSVVWVPNPPRDKFILEPSAQLAGSGSLHVRDQIGAAFTLDDGSRLRMGPGAAIDILSPQRLRLQDGDAWLTTAGQKWTVELPIGEIGSSAGDFVVYAGSQLTQVTVLAGTVQYTLKKKSQVLYAGDGLIITAAGPRPVQQAYALPKYLGWTFDLLALEAADRGDRKWLLRELFSGLGATDIGSFCEEALVSPFGSAALPLAIDLLQNDFTTTPSTRLRAASVVARVANRQLDDAIVETLFELALDDDRSVRAPMIKALEAATGTSAILPEELFDGDRKTRAGILAKWRSLWEAQNEARKPADMNGERP